MADLKQSMMAAAALIAALFLQASRADALEHLTVQMAFYPQGPQAYLFIAKDKGWFEEAGLDVEILDGRGSAYSMQVLSGGHADIGEGQLSPLASARERGADVKAIAEWYKKDGPAIIVPKESGMNSPADLKGKKVVLIAAGPWPPLLNSFFAQFGMKPTDMQLLYVDPSALFTTYATGQADAMLTVDLAFTEADPMRPSRLMSAVNYGVKLPGDGLYVTQKTLAERRDTLVRFLAVCGRALTYTFDGHEEEAAKAVRKLMPATKLSAEHIQHQIVQYKPLRFTEATAGKPPGWMSPADWIERIAYMKGVGILKNQHGPEDFFTNELIEAGAK